MIVNNAGIGRWLFIEETPLEEMRADMALPYFAAFGVTKAFVAEMAGRGSGNICNVNGPGGWFPWPSSVAYSSARWALRGFSTALRVDFRDTGVSVTDVVMTKISSSYWENNPGADDRMPWIDRVIPTLSEERAAEVVTRAVERERQRRRRRRCTRRSTTSAESSPDSCTGWCIRRRPPADILIAERSQGPTSSVRVGSKASRKRRSWLTSTIAPS